MSVLVVGTVAFDTIETPSGSDKTLGGSAMYASAAASFFAPAQLIGVVGDDFEAQHLRFFERLGVCLQGLERRPGKTFHWAGRYSADFSNRETLATDLNVLADYSPKLPDKLRDAEILMLANIHPQQQIEALSQARMPRLVALDTMNLWINTCRDDLQRALKQVDLLILNDEEARQLAQTPQLVKAGEALLKMGPRRVVVKKGEHGVLCFSEEGSFGFPAYPVADVVDPTGAGDCFAGAMLGCLASERALDESAYRRAMVYGAVLGSFVVEGLGPEKLRSLTRKEIETRRKELLQFAAAPNF